MNKQSMNDCLVQLQAILRPDQILIEEPLKNHTTFQIGGPADLLLLPESTEEVAGVMQILQKQNYPWICLGNGSNVLASDGGFRGVVVKLGPNFAQILRKQNQIVAQAGALLKEVAQFAAQESLAGFEFAVGIPGSLGGAVFMNAGAYDGEIAQLVTGVRAVMPNGEIREFSQDGLSFAYRHSIFQDNGAVICEVLLSLQAGDKKIIQAKMADLTAKRESKQPLEMPSAGSTFKRPPGYFAGTLIEQTGLKGFQVGGAQVSEKHAGFVVNAGDATAEDVKNLIKEVQTRVYSRHGVMLYPEVKMIDEEK